MCPCGGDQSGSTCGFPSWPPGRSPPLSPPPGCCSPSSAGCAGVVVAGRAGRARKHGGGRRGGVPGPGTGRPGRGLRSRLGRPHPQRPSGKDGWPLVAWRLPTAPEPRRRQDVAFATLPGTDRKVLCDVWQPPADVPASGLAVVYLHGSAWCMLDKDVGTRPLFRHLAAQGHLIVDVAYRLFPDTNQQLRPGPAPGLSHPRRKKNRQLPAICQQITSSGRTNTLRGDRLKKFAVWSTTLAARCRHQFAASLRYR
jgi:hypothetical protein